MYSMKHFLRKRITSLNFENLRNYQSLEKHPKTPVVSLTKNKVDSNTIDLLERLSLVDCVNNKDIKTLEAAIDFAEQIFEINTSEVTPLITVLEDYPLRVREDKVTEGNTTDILKNAIVIEEDYFVAPPGNIPLQGDNNKK